MEAETRGSVCLAAAAAALLTGISTASAGMVFNFGTKPGDYSTPLNGTFQKPSTITCGVD